MADALREAAQKALKALETYPVTVNHWKTVLLPTAEALRDALSVQGEPVAYRISITAEPELGHWYDDNDHTGSGFRSEPLYAAPAAATAPSAQLFSPHQEQAMDIIQKAAAGIQAMRAEVWNAAIEAAALVVQPVPHIDEERTCSEVAAAIRALKALLLSSVPARSTPA